jgi:hypothetical protein
VNFDGKFAEIVGFEMEEEYTVGTIWFGEALGGMPAVPVRKFGVEDVLRRVD